MTHFSKKEYFILKSYDKSLIWNAYTLMLREEKSLREKQCSKPEIWQLVNLYYITQYVYMSSFIQNTTYSMPQHAHTQWQIIQQLENRKDFLFSEMKIQIRLLILKFNEESKCQKFWIPDKQTLVTVVWHSDTIFWSVIGQTGIGINKRRF